MAEPQQEENNHNDEEPQYNSLIFFIDPKASRRTLYKTDSLNLFLTKLSVLFTFYFGLMLGICLFAYYYGKTAREYYLKSQIFKHLIIYGSLSLIIKIVFSFFGFIIRKFSYILFLFDIIFTLLTVFGIFIEIEGFFKTQYVTYGYLAIMLLFYLTFGCFGMILGAMIRDRKRIYNYWFALFLTLLFDLGAYFLSMWIFEDLSTQSTNHLITFGIALLIQLYMITNMYMVIHFRKNKFYEHEFIYCFFCFWTDFLWIFWLDMCKKRKKLETEVVLDESSNHDPNSHFVVVKDETFEE